MPIRDDFDTMLEDSSSTSNYNDSHDSMIENSPSKSINDEYSSLILSDSDLHLIHSSLAACQRIINHRTNENSAIDIETLIQSLIQSHKKTLTLNSSLSSIIADHRHLNGKFAEVSGDYKNEIFRHRECQRTKRAMEDKLFLAGISLDVSIPTVTLHHDNDSNDSDIIETQNSLPVKKSCEEFKEHDASFGLFQPVTFRGFDEENDEIISSPIKFSSPTKTPLSSRDSTEQTPMTNKMSPSWTPNTNNIANTPNLNDSSDINYTSDNNHSDSVNNISLESAVLNLDQQFAHLTSVIATQTRDAHHHTIIESAIQHMKIQHKQLTQIIREIKLNLIIDENNDRNDENNSENENNEQVDTNSLNSLLINISSQIEFISISLPSLLTFQQDFLLNDSTPSQNSNNLSASSGSMSPPMLPEVLLQASKIESLLTEIQTLENNQQNKEINDSIIQSLIKQITVNMNNIQSTSHHLENEMNENLKNKNVAQENENEMISLRDEIFSSRSIINENNLSISSLESELSALRSHQQKVDDETLGIEKELKELILSLQSESEEKNNKNEEKILLLIKENEKLNEMLDNKQFAISSHIEDFITKNISNQEIEFGLEYKKWKNSEFQLQEKIKCLQTELFELSTNMQKMEQEKNSIIEQLQLEELNSIQENEKLMENFDQARREELEQRIKKLKNSLTETQTELEKAKTEQREASNKANQFELIVKTLTVERDELDSCIITLKEASEKLTFDLAEAEINVSQLKSLAISKVEASPTVTENSEELKNSLKQELESSAEKTRKITEFESRLKLLNKEHEQLADNYEQLELKYEKEIESKEILQQSIQQLDNQLSQEREKLDDNKNIENNEKNAQILELESTIKQFMKQNEKLSAESNQLLATTRQSFENEITDLKNELEINKATIKKLEQEIAELKIRSQQQASESKIALDEKQKLLDEIESQSQTIEQLQSKHSLSTDERNELDNCIITLKQASEKLTVELAEAEVSVNELQIANKCLKDSQFHHKEVVQNLHELEISKIAIEEHREQLVKELESFKLSASQFELQSDESAATIEELEGQIQILNERFDEMKIEMEKLKLNHKENLNKAEEETKWLREESNHLIVSTRQSFNSEISELTNQLKSASETVKNFEQEINELTTRNISHQQEFNELEANRDRLLKEFETLESSAMSSESRADQFISTKSELEFQIQTREEEIEKIRDEINLLNLQHEKSSTEAAKLNESLKNELNELVATTRQSFDNEITDLNNELESKNEKIKILERNRIESKTENISLRHQVDEIENTRDQLLAEVKDLKLSASQFQSEAEDSNSSITKLECQIQALNQKIDEMKIAMDSREFQHEKDLHGALAEKKSLGDELESLTSEILSMERILSAADINIKEQQFQNNSSMLQIQSLTGERDELLNKIDSNNKEYKKCLLAKDNSYQSLTKEIELLKNKHEKELKNTLKSYEISLSSAILQTKNSITGEYEGQIKSLKNEIKTSTNEIELLTKELDSIKNSMNSMKLNYETELFDKNHSNIATNHKNSLLIIEMEAKIQILHETSEKLIKEKAKVENSNKNETKVQANLAEEIENENNELKTLKNSLNKIKGEFSSYQRENCSTIETLTIKLEEFNKLLFLEKAANIQLNSQLTNLKEEIKSHEELNERTRTLTNELKESQNSLNKEKLNNSILAKQLKDFELVRQQQKNADIAANDLLKEKNKNLEVKISSLQSTIESSKLNKEKEFNETIELKELNSSLKIDIAELKLSNKELISLSESLKIVKNNEKQLIKEELCREFSLINIEKETKISDLIAESFRDKEKIKKLEINFRSSQIKFDQEKLLLENKFHSKIDSLEKDFQQIKNNKNFISSEEKKNQKDRIIIHTRLMPVYTNSNNKQKEELDSDEEDLSSSSFSPRSSISSLTSQSQRFLRRSDDSSVSDLCCLLDELNDHVASLQDENNNLNRELINVKKDRRDLLDKHEEQRRKFITASNWNNSRVSISFTQRRHPNNDWQCSQEKHYDWQ